MQFQRALTLATSVFETLFFAGIIYGWASLHGVFVKEGYFSSSCEKYNETNSTGTSAPPSCSSQRESLSLVFSISSSLPPLLSIAYGKCMDRYGCWCFRTMSITVILAGFLLTAASSARSPWLLYAAMPCISVGGNMLLLANFQNANLHSYKRRAAAVTLLNGFFDSATVVFLLVSKLYDGGVSVSAIFCFMALWCAALHARTFLLTPRRSVPQILPERYKYGYKELPCCEKVIDEIGGGRRRKSLSKPAPAASKRRESNVSLSDAKTFRECVRETHTWTNVFHVAVNQLRIFFFIGELNSWLASIAPDGADLTRYVAVFGYLQCTGVFTSPLCGVVIQHFTRKFARTLPLELATQKAVAVAFCITDMIIIAMSVTSLVPALQLQYVTFVLQVLARSFLFGTSSVFVSVFYPARHFGVLYALPVFVGGLVLLLQIPITLLVSRVFDDDYTAVNGALLALTLLGAVHPVLLMREVNGKIKDAAADNATDPCDDGECAGSKADNSSFNSHLREIPEPLGPE